MTQSSPLASPEPNTSLEERKNVEEIQREPSIPKAPLHSEMQIEDIATNQSTWDSAELRDVVRSSNAWLTSNRTSSNSDTSHDLDMPEKTDKGIQVVSRFELKFKTPEALDSAATGSEDLHESESLPLEEPMKVSVQDELLKTGTSARLGDEDIQLLHTDNMGNPKDNDRRLEPIGKWRCCKCTRGQDIYNFSLGAHPVSILNCVCTHRSCNKCTLSGQIKRFAPMNEPEVVQLSEGKYQQMRFGIFCDACGLSWRAQEVSAELLKKSGKNRISKIPRLLSMKSQPVPKLRPSKSMNNVRSAQSANSSPSSPSSSSLNLRQLSSEMEKGHGKQAEFATVRFTGIRCTCGMDTVNTSLCFQVVDLPLDIQEPKTAKLKAEVKVPPMASTPEDRAKGHSTPVLHLKNGRYSNPLMSNPVNE